MSSPAQAQNTAALAGKYLTVVLDREAYGIAVLKVREIIRMQAITPVPHVPAHVRGVINLRGRMIPVVDLRVKFGLKSDFGDRTCIIVVQLTLPGASSVVPMGLIVDSVEEVVNLGGADIEPPPAFGSAGTGDCLLGLAKVRGKVKLLLDIDRVVSGDASAAGEETAAA